MENKLTGKAWFFEGVMDVDWEICPVEHMRGFQEDSSVTYSQRLEELGKYCMTVIDPDFPKKVSLGDFIIGGHGFGYGHDHDHACMAIRGVGVAAVLCESTNSNFKRNAIHHGLPVVEAKGISEIVKTGDMLELSLPLGVISNQTNGKELRFTPYPDFILEILDAGNLYAQLEKNVKAGEYE